MLRIATRRSALARAQAFQVGRALAARAGGGFELVPMAASGDLQPERAVADFDTKGLFVDTIRQAVASGDCDVAVHSYKDLPTQPVDGLVVGAIPEREDPRDLLVTRDGHALGTLPELATVGTSSQRRSLQLLRARPGLRVRGIRGNLDTRLGKVADGEFDAVVVAHAGLRRLYVARSDGGVGPLDLPLTAVALEPGECLPAPGQGALAVECRAGDERALAACRLLDDPATRRAVEAERAFLVRVGGGCLAPVGALARGVPGGLELRGLVGDPGTRRVAEACMRGPAEHAERLGRDLADRLVAGGGGELLAAVARLRSGGPGAAV